MKKRLLDVTASQSTKQLGSVDRHGNEHTRVVSLHRSSVQMLPSRHGRR